MKRRANLLMILAALGLSLLSVTFLLRRGVSSPGEGDVRSVGGVDFVYIPGGEYLMGSPSGEGSDPDETPSHRVAVDSFWMGRFEVTQKQYRDIMGKSESRFRGDDLPMEKVSWHEAREFSRRFGERYGVRARLPYEAEWEYACRAGSTTRYYWGDTLNTGYCWYYANSGDSTHPVGKKMPNRWGLYDMSGNVWEWCMDWYDERYYAVSPSRNPRGPAEGKLKVIRGGSWYYIDNDVHSACRLRNYPDRKYIILGFRLVLEP